MKKISFIEKILSSSDEKTIKKFLDKIDVILSSYDEFMDDIYSDIFYELYLNESKDSYLKIAVRYNISTSKVCEMKKRIEEYCKKLIYRQTDYFDFKKYL